MAGHKQTLGMLKDFPRKKKVFSIAEMKEIENSRARGGVRSVDGGKGSGCSLSAAFQSISGDVEFEKTEEDDRDDVYGSVRIRGLSSSLEMRLSGDLSVHSEGKGSLVTGARKCGDDASRREFGYDGLSTLQRIELSRFCWNAFQTTSKNRFFNWVNCFHRTNIRRRRKMINPKVFEIVEVLRRKATRTRFIFRYEPDKSAAIEIARDLDRSREISCEEVDVLVLANALKNYIREHLDGLIPIEVFEKIKSCMVANDRHRKEALFSYVPFIFSDVERNLLKSLFELFGEIDKNYSETEMTLDSLLGLFSLVLHPQAAFTTLDDLVYVQAIMKEVYFLDFDTLPQAVVVHELIFI